MRDTISRRQVLTGLSTVAVTAAAGCSSIAESLASSVFEDVNVINELDRRISGSITVTDPNGETVLDETFDLRPEAQTEQTTETDGNAAVVRYGDVFTTTGVYDLSVRLDEAVDGVREGSDTVEVTDTDSTQILVGIEADDDSGVISIGTLGGESTDDN
jgi:hypothetical protein